MPKLRAVAHNGMTRRLLPRHAKDHSLDNCVSCTGSTEDRGGMFLHYDLFEAMAWAARSDDALYPPSDQLPCRSVSFRAGRTKRAAEKGGSGFVPAYFDHCGSAFAAVLSARSHAIRTRRFDQLDRADRRCQSASASQPLRLQADRGFFTPEMSFAVDTLARQQGRSLQALMAESFNDVLCKYGESPIGE